MRSRTRGWQIGMLVNGLGGLSTGLVVVIITVTKFLYGAWMILIFIPLMIYMFKSIRRHYNSVAAQLHVPEECLAQEQVWEQGENIVIVPVSTPTRVVFETMKYAKRIGSRVLAVHIASDEESERKLREKWQC